MGSSPISATNGPLVKRLRHRPFTAVTGVRFSHGSPKKNTCTMCRCSFLSSRVHSTRQSAKALCGSSHLRLSRRGARSPAARREIFAAGEILPLYSLSKGASFRCFAFLRSKMATLAIKQNSALSAAKQILPLYSLSLYKSPPRATKRLLSAVFYLLFYTHPTTFCTDSILGRC